MPHRSNGQGDPFEAHLGTTELVIGFAAADQVAHKILAPGWSEQLPALSEAQKDRLQTGFSEMTNRGLEPEVVYYPTGLSWRTWADILTSHKLVDGRSSEGVQGKFLQEMPERDDSLAHQRKRWGVALICGKNAATSLDTQRQDATSLGVMPVGASCSTEQYYALQWKRLIEGRSPVDDETATIVAAQVSELCLMSWDPFKKSIIANYVPLEGVYENVGYRLALSVS